MEKKFSNLRSVQVVRLIRVSVNEGKGTEEDPVTRVRNYFDFEGNLLWHTEDIEREFRGDKTNI